MRELPPQKMLLTLRDTRERGGVLHCIALFISARVFPWLRTHHMLLVFQCNAFGGRSCIGSGSTSLFYAARHLPFCICILQISTFLFPEVDCCIYSPWLTLYSNWDICTICSVFAIFHNIRRIQMILRLSFECNWNCKKWKFLSYQLIARKILFSNLATN